MRITLLQTDVVWGKPEENLQHIEQMLENVGESDLIVLPEMFTTGFDTNPEGTADDQGLALKWMRRIVRERNCALAGSVATKAGEKYYNRMYFVSPDLLLASYDKHHLFKYGGEDICFTPGQRRVVVPFRGVRILLQVCYDLRFPVFSRNWGDYDLALYVANWPQGRQEAWNTLLRARAIENQCYVAGVNRVGADDNGAYAGGSMLIDINGNVIADGTNNEECIITGDIDMDKLNAFRKEFSVLEDADPYKLFKTTPAHTAPTDHD